MSAVVVVESPAKAKTIEKYLGKGYKVLASYGHVRAFPKKDGSVDPEHDFAITYQIIEDKKKRLDAIDRAMKKADTLILASDLDREGEAIAWHVYEVLKERGTLEGKRVQRITFHEITKKAIQEAIEHPTEIDMKLVDAQQARSALDYLVGFTLSPLLWRKIRSGLSAGRVQSVALRLICEREQHIREFKPREFWTIEAACRQGGDGFDAQLYAVDGKKLGKFAITDGVNAKLMARKVEAGAFRVVDVQKKQVRQQPAPPFITTTMQMEASRKLGFTARKTMQIAQKLYEGIEVDGEPVGLITYMRTDSVSLAAESVAEMREHIAQAFGQDYLPSRPRIFKTKSKNAQEAHEAIRPTSILRTPEAMKKVLDADSLKLYTLIWKRALASQMAPALLDQVRADIEAEGEQRLTLRATGSTLAFPGFRALYIESSDEPEKQDQKNRLLPPLSVGDAIEIERAEARQHFTEPKPRFTEASLVKELEANGIGRPSTYASILNVLRERKYVEMDRKRFVPTDVGEWVNRFLVESFGNIVDVGFTAAIEDKLDAIARGELEWKPVLREFWEPFKADVDKAAEAGRPSEQTDEICPECGKPLAIKLGRYGKFLACTGYPECRYSRPLNGNNEAQPEPEKTDQVCEKCGEPMVIKNGRFGRFLACSAYPKCRNSQPLEKPKDTGIACPQCGKGTFLEKRSRRGKIFYSCSQYPKCKNALWNKPVDRPCPKCHAPFVTEKVTKRHGTEYVCATEGCGWKEQVEAPEAA